MTPKDIVDSCAPAIDAWLAGGPGLIYQFDIAAENYFAEMVVRELTHRGYAAIMKREFFICDCVEHKGLAVESQYVAIKVTRCETLMKHPAKRNTHNAINPTPQ